MADPVVPSSGDFSTATYEQILFAVTGQGSDLRSIADAGDGRGDPSGAWLKVASTPSASNSISYHAWDTYYFGFDVNMAAFNAWQNGCLNIDGITQRAASGKTGLLDVQRLFDAMVTADRYLDFLHNGQSMVQKWVDSLSGDDAALRGKAAYAILGNLNRLSFTFTDLSRQLTADRTPSTVTGLKEAALALGAFGVNMANIWNQHRGLINLAVQNLNGFLVTLDDYLIQQGLDARAKTMSVPGGKGYALDALTDNGHFGRSIAENYIKDRLAAFAVNSTGERLTGPMAGIKGDLKTGAPMNQFNPILSDLLRAELDAMDQQARIEFEKLDAAYQRAGLSLGDLQANQPPTVGILSSSDADTTLADAGLTSPDGSGLADLAGGGADGTGLPDFSGGGADGTGVADLAGGGAGGTGVPDLSGGGTTIPDFAGGGSGVADLANGGATVPNLSTGDSGAGVGLPTSGGVLFPNLNPGGGTDDSHAGVSSGVIPTVPNISGQVPDGTIDEHGWSPNPITVPNGSGSGVPSLPSSGGGGSTSGFPGSTANGGLSLGPGATPGSGPAPDFNAFRATTPSPSLDSWGSAGGGAGLDSVAGLGSGAAGGGLSGGLGSGVGGVGGTGSGAVGTGSAGGWADWAGTGAGSGSAAAGAPGAAGTSASSGYGGMPYMPMGGAGAGAGGGREEKERERATWLTEDDKVWGTDSAAGLGVIGRPDIGLPETDEPLVSTHVHLRSTTTPVAATPVEREAAPTAESTGN
ncbi:hypothetical protein [Actinokineospora inagensis]|uniref:hypothetical protein n=1 Tax=Actinokineospora inagensis TaxID=103730 RepID=UPI0004004F87|nr:hypothetical protein [Actinokineospora inagensis]